jgi:hypothetical protein
MPSQAVNARSVAPAAIPTVAIRVVASVDEAPPPERGVLVAVLDTTWTPGPGDRPDLLPIRPIVIASLRERDPLAHAMTVLDAFGDAMNLPATLKVHGVSYWHTWRMRTWRTLQNRLVWIWILRAVLAEAPGARLELPTGEPELVAAARDVVPPESLYVAEADVGQPDPASANRPLIDPILWRLGRHPRQRARVEADRLRAERDGRRAAMEARLMALGMGTRAGAAPDAPDAGGGDRGEGRRPLLVLTNPRVHQVVGGPDGTRRIDPFLGSVVAALERTPLEPVLLELEVDVDDDATWARLAGPGSERSLPGEMTNWRASAEDRDLARTTADEIATRLGVEPPVVDDDGLDLGPSLLADLRHWVTRVLPGRLRTLLGARRLLADLRPAGVLLINEYSLPEWLIAARLEGVPTTGVQHGVIHRHHPGYVMPRRDGLAVPDTFCCFGRWEARLITEQSRFDPAGVRVTGSPRLDLVPAPAVQPGADKPAERLAVRRELGVADADRLLVLSSTSSWFVRRFSYAAVLDAVVDRSLPSVHLVVKLHPAEEDDGFYRRFMYGIARARGIPPPRLTIVKAIDLYRLLRAADAHLGIHSTVLTDAVVAGTRNLVATCLAGADLLDYVAAGVAIPVRDGGELLAALDAPHDPVAWSAARAAFLAEHFEPGRAGQRIADELIGRLAPATSR